MSQKLPVLVRKHIRDLINDPEGEVQQTLKLVNTAIGTTFHLEITWEDVYRDLKPSFPEDFEKLVPSIGRQITIFLNRLQSVMEQDERFQKTFLKHRASLGSDLAVVVNKDSRSACKIIDRRVTLLLPNTGSEGFKYAQASVGSDLPSLFGDEGNQDGKSAPGGGGGGGQETRSNPAATIDDKDHNRNAASIVSVRGGSSGPKQYQFQDTAAIKRRPLPNPASLQHPDVLFSDVLPAFLSLTRSNNNSELIIEGSHAPTITLIAEYFGKHTRKDMFDANQIPRFSVERVTSNWGIGTMNDAVYIDLGGYNREWRVNLPLFFSFVEGVCGYELVDVQGNLYLYKRTVPF